MERLSLAKGGDFLHLTSAKEWLLSFGGFVANSGVSGTSACQHPRSAPRRSHEESTCINRLWASPRLRHWALQRSPRRRQQTRAAMAAPSAPESSVALLPARSSAALSPIVRLPRHRPTTTTATIRLRHPSRFIIRLRVR